MSGLTTAAIVAGSVAAVAGAGAGIASAVSASKQAKAAQEGVKVQQQAAVQANKNADVVAVQQSQAIHNSLAKQADLPTIMAATQKGNAGGGGTLLTGPGGVNSGSLSLGKTSLLGA